MPDQYSQSGYAASFGTYQIDESTHTFSYHVEGALVRPLIGKDLPRIRVLRQTAIREVHSPRGTLESCLGALLAHSAPMSRMGRRRIYPRTKSWVRGKKLEASPGGTIEPLRF